jgi:hypothetical protein
VSALQKPDATNLAGFRTWNSLGRFVKRGEKGILILAPMVGYGRARQNESATEIETDNAADERKPEQQLIGFRAVYVFDRLSRDLWPSLCALDLIRQCHFRKPLDSSKQIIAQFPRNLQHANAGLSAIGIFCPPIRVLSANAWLSKPSYSARFG